MPTPFHLGCHGTSIPGLLPGFGHSGLGGSVGWADPHTRAAFAFIHNRFITRMVLDQASSARLGAASSTSCRQGRQGGVSPVGEFGAGYVALPTAL
jgi:CubicO group peptidase (beta-lactamase class C family)